MDRPRRSGRASGAPSQYASTSYATAPSSSRAVYHSPSPAVLQQQHGKAGAGGPAVGMSRPNAPIPPQTPLAPGQALFTTFAARAKLGVSTLVQPLPSECGPLSGGGMDYGTTERTRGGGMRRRAAAGMRYYGEDGSDFDEDDDDDEDDSSPSKANTPMAAVEEEESAPGTLLAAPPPGRKILAKRAPPVHPLVYPDADMLAQADRREFLVPIKIDFETDTHRFHDVFTWNLREQLIKPGDFARIYLQDLDVPLNPYAGMVEQMIIDQLQQAQNAGYDLVEIGPAAGGPFASRDGKKRTRDARNWDHGLRRTDAKDIKDATVKKAKTNGIAHGNGVNGNSTDIDGMDDATRWDAEGPLGAFEDDVRVVVDYDVQIYRHHLRDRLEWDLCSPLTPEAFAKQMCKDLCLTGEALPIISNAVREQLLNHSRSAIDLEVFGKGAEHARWQREIEDADRDIVENRKRNAKGLPPLPSKPIKVLSEAADEESAAASQELLNPRRRGRSALAVTAVAQAAAAAFAASATAGDENPALHSAAAATPTIDETRSGTMTPASAMTGQAAPGMLSSAAVGKLLAPPSARPNAFAQQPSTLSSTQAILRTPAQRRAIAEYMQQQLTEKGGARRLRGVWRDYYEAREFGPLLEFLTDEDLERIDTEAARSRRRGRREIQRTSQYRRGRR